MSKSSYKYTTEKEFLLNDIKVYLAGSHLSHSNNKEFQNYNEIFFKNYDSKKSKILVLNELPLNWFDSKNMFRFGKSLMFYMNIFNKELVEKVNNYDMILLPYYENKHVISIIVNIKEKYIVAADSEKNLINRGVIRSIITFLTLLFDKDLNKPICDSVNGQNRILYKTYLISTGIQSENWFCESYRLSLFDEIIALENKNKKSINYEDIKKIIEDYEKNNTVCKYLAWFYKTNHENIKYFKTDYELIYNKLLDKQTVFPLKINKIRYNLIKKQIFDKQLEYIINNVNDFNHNYFSCNPNWQDKKKSPIKTKKFQQNNKIRNFMKPKYIENGIICIISYGSNDMNITYKYNDIYYTMHPTEHSNFHISIPLDTECLWQ